MKSLNERTVVVMAAEYWAKVRKEGAKYAKQICQDSCSTGGQISSSSSSSSFFSLKLNSYPALSSLYPRVDILVLSVVTLNFALGKIIQMD